MAKLTNGNISFWHVSSCLSHNNTANHPSKSEIEKTWLSRLAEDHLQQSQSEKDSIVQWLLGPRKEDWNSLTWEQQAIHQQRSNDRYQILKQRYLNVTAIQAYRNLINRLSLSVVLQQNRKSWLSGNRDGQRALLKVVQLMIQEMLKQERYILEQMKWIAQCTSDESLRNRLLLASIEEYYLRRVDHQPLFLHCFFNYLRHNTQQKSVLMLLESLSMTLDENQMEVHYPVVSV